MTQLQDEIALQLDSLELTYMKDSQLVKIIKNLTITINNGDIVCLLGPSGSGKTTILRAIAGFHKIDSGRILIQGKEVSTKKSFLEPEKRKVGMVFQDHALFPHLDVQSNVSFGIQYLNHNDRKARVSEMLELVGLNALRGSSINELSGGQQQRVALARALAPKPSLLLMDEPFSDLDLALKERLTFEVRDLLKKTKTTCIIVTHDQNEAFAVSDKIGLISDNKLQQFGTSRELFLKPKNRFVANFLGEGVFVPGKIENKNELVTEFARFSVKDFDENLLFKKNVDLLLRPDAVKYNLDSDLKAKVLKKEFRGTTYLYTLELPNGQKILSLVPSQINHDIGNLIGITFELKQPVFF